MKTKTLSFSALVKPFQFSYVNSNIEKMPLEPVRSSEYKLFHFDRYLSSEDAVKEIEAAGYSPARLSELLSWKEWNKKDSVIALGQSSLVDGDRGVPGLWEGSGRWDLGLGSWALGWGSGFRFLAIKNESSKPSSSDIENAELDEGFVSRFWAQVDKTDTCWNWIGAKHEQGYGLIKKGDTSVRAHRISVLMSGREIPKGDQIDHLCKNTSCVNPNHLEVVSSKENTLRGDGPTAKNAQKTHCIRGHEFTEENTRIRLNDDGGSSRVCRTCANLRHSYE